MGHPMTIVGLGEALFDVFGDREVLGGAPLNVAVHAQQLASAVGGRGLPASRVGRDALGERLLRELSDRGVSTAAIQRDDRHPTGRVLVTVQGGEPSYEIVRDAAWDHLAWDDDWRQLAEQCSAVCFGTLAQRSPQSRETILSFVRQARQAIRMFDVNLRRDGASAEVVRESCALATVVKLNDQELPTVARWLDLPGSGEAGPTASEGQATALRERFGLNSVVMTRGAAGTIVYTVDGRAEGEPPRYCVHREADAVGAGDACSAGILVGMLLGWPAGRTVALANAAGAFVASRPGATPRFPATLLQMVTDEAATARPSATSRAARCDSRENS